MIFNNEKNHVYLPSLPLPPPLSLSLFLLPTLTWMYISANPYEASKKLFSL